MHVTVPSRTTCVTRDANRRRIGDQGVGSRRGASSPLDRYPRSANHSRRKRTPRIAARTSVCDAGSPNSATWVVLGEAYDNLCMVRIASSRVV